MRKVFLVALMATISVAGYSVIANAGAGEAGTSWDFSFKPNKVKKAAASHSEIRPAKVDDQGTADKSDDLYTSTEKTTIIFAKGSSVDTSAMARCKLSASEVGAGEECPGKTRLGKGEAEVVVGGEQQPDKSRKGGTALGAEVDAFNQKNKILFVVTTCGPGTGPGTGTDCSPAGPPNVLEGKWSNITTKPKLVVPTTQSLLDIGVVITRFELDTDKHTKTVKQNGKEVLKSFVFTPETCKGKWKTSAIADYEDGTSQTIKDTQKCKQPG